jgi:hypothetical protein
MRRYVMAGIGAVLVIGLAACGDSGDPQHGAGTRPSATDSAAPPPSAAGPDLIASPAGPATGVAALTAAERAVCARRTDVVSAFASHRVLYLGTVSGWHEGNVEQQKKVLGELKGALAGVRGLFADAVKQATNARFRTAAQADLAAVDKLTADLAAAGTDDSGKAVAALGVDTVTTFQLATLCSAEM